MNIGNLYVDMDGVLAGCDQGIADFCGIDVDHFLSFPREGDGRHQFWIQSIRHGDIEKFFADLPFEPNANYLINWINKNRNEVNPHILSKPIREPNTGICIAGKKEWLSRNGINWPAIFEAKKYKYAVSNGKQNVLIDDFEENVYKWNKAGGIGIFYNHQNVANVIGQLEYMYS